MLPLTVGDTYTFETGEGDDPGLHSPTDEFPLNVADFIMGLVPEEDLEEVPGVNPLDTSEEIEALEGKQFCVVVYEDDVEYEDGLAELDEDRVGVTAFEVTGTVAPEDDDEDLPWITIQALDPCEVCAVLDADVCNGPVPDDDEDDD